jgi:serine kinase of HPr protein (carbohydrate metabolism regulator)
MNMKLQDIISELELKILSSQEYLDRKVSGAYCSDLLSDVMGNADEGQIWITLQTHKNIMAVAALKELAAIILVKGLIPEKDVLALSEKENIPVLSTTLPAFEIAGKLYQLLEKELNDSRPIYISIQCFHLAEAWI